MVVLPLQHQDRDRDDRQIVDRIGLGLRALLLEARDEQHHCADSELLGRGLGTAMVRAFVTQLFADPAVTRVQTDSAPGNRRAIRCYEKAGFRAQREVDTPDGRALLMYCDRLLRTGP